VGILSMTGFGAASFEADGERFRIEVKSVNHRGTNVRFRAPGELAALEVEAVRSSTMTP
jgi:uncharacterized protein YicC (UPF0701 family)